MKLKPLSELLGPCLVFVLSCSACSPDPLQTRRKFLAPATDQIDFGEQETGTEGWQTLYLFNEGDEPIALEQPRGILLGTVFKTRLSDVEIPPGGDVVVDLVFTPWSAVDYVTTILIGNDSTNESRFQMQLMGTGVNYDPCAGVVCNSPPQPLCVTASTSRYYAAVGTCREGICLYDASAVQCDPPGCEADTGLCFGDPCFGVACQTPPNTCFFTNGHCVDGGCTYFAHDEVNCTDGDPCTLGDRCSGGVCRGSTWRLCDMPPSNTCVDERYLRHWDPRGYCDLDGACQYAHQDIFCEFGCLDNQCIDDPCAGGCDDGDPCTIDDCTFRVGCEHLANSGASCVTRNIDCPQGQCIGTTCAPVAGVTCEAEYQADLCRDATIAGDCTAAGQCVITDIPDTYYCSGCTGICLQCYFIRLCLGF